jgi:hypothetical protein
MRFDHHRRDELRARRSHVRNRRSR